MSSIMTNAGAMTALQTLKATNKNLETTQGRISTGYRVSEAAHNAAYWSIATTMRSDNNAMSTVRDALGLGAAQVDIAYTAMDVVKDTLDQIKKKLVAASEPDVDKRKIQAEIEQLQNDLRTFAKSATFSGGNWLDVQQASVEKVVASFIRDTNGSISLGTIDVDTSKTALINAAPGQDGLLETTISVTPGSESIDLSGLGAPVSAGGGAPTPIPATNTITGFNSVAWAVGDVFTFDIDLGSGPSPISVTAGAGGVFDFNTALAGTGVTAEIVGGALVFTGNDVIGSIEIDNLSATDSGSVVIPLAGLGTPDSDPLDFTPAPTPTVTVAGFGDAGWEEGDTFTFSVTVNGTPETITVTAGAGGVFDFDTALAAVFTDPDDAVTATVNPSGELVFTGAGANVGSLALSGLSGGRGGGVPEDVNVLTMNITALNRDDLQRLLNHVDEVFGSVTTAASDLGAIKTRIASQQDFVSKIMDAVSRGVGQLVDADMEEESTRLQALQVQQQLGIQALSIANGNAQNILALFRG